MTSAVPLQDQAVCEINAANDEPTRSSGIDAVSRHSGGRSGTHEAAWKCASLALANAREHHSRIIDSPESFPQGCDGALLPPDRELVAHLSSALDTDRVQLALQPVVDVRTKWIAFHEALLRLECVDGILSSAADSIQAAERDGLASTIDRRTLSLAAEILAEAPNVNLSLNVSAHTCRDQIWLAQLREITAGSPGIAKRLIVEITETAEIEDFRDARAFVENIKSLGCRAALDDFGAGFTSFDSLLNMPFDLVKIDGSFIKNVATSPADRAFVGALAELAAKQGIETVAEWVVDERCAEVVAALGIDYMQGFYFGAPQPLEDIISPTR